MEYIYNFKSVYFEETTILSIKDNDILLFEIRLAKRSSYLEIYIWQQSRMLSILTDVSLKTGDNVFVIDEKDSKVVVEINGRKEEIEKHTNNIELILTNTIDNEWIYNEFGKQRVFKQNKRRN